MKSCVVRGELPRSSGTEALMLAAVIAGTLLVVIVVAALLLWHPGCCGLLPHTLGDDVAVHGPAVVPVIRLI